MTKDEFFDFMDDFNKYRCDYGVKKDVGLNERLYPNIRKLHKEL